MLAFPAFSVVLLYEKETVNLFLIFAAMSIFSKLFHFSAVSVFPSRCPYCDKVIDDSDYACKICPRNFPGFCYSRYTAGGFLCAAPFPYSGVYAKAVKALKFHNRGDYARPLAAQLVRAVSEIHGDVRFDYVTCVPMHRKDKRNRGYNQAELLARECAALMRLTYLDTLEKFKRNQPQHKTGGRDREKNVYGVYRLIDEDIIKDKNVLIIDDIITTGNTVGECARILSNGKCAEIRCAVVCSADRNKFIAPGQGSDSACRKGPAQAQKQ